MQKLDPTVVPFTVNSGVLILSGINHIFYYKITPLMKQEWYATKIVLKFKIIKLMINVFCSLFSYQCIIIIYTLPQ